VRVHRDPPIVDDPLLETFNVPERIDLFVRSLYQFPLSVFSAPSVS
jgi:hypothetical protein